MRNAKQCKLTNVEEILTGTGVEKATNSELHEVGVEVVGGDEPARHPATRL